MYNVAKKITRVECFARFKQSYLHLVASDNEREIERFSINYIEIELRTNKEDLALSP